MIGQRIKELREERGFSQNDLAKILEIAQSSVGNYEREDRLPDADIILKLVDIFNVSADYLLGLCPYKKPENASIVEKTGLDDDAISSLEIYKTYGMHRILSLLLVSEAFERFVNVIFRHARRLDELSPKGNSISIVEFLLKEDIRRDNTEGGKYEDLLFLLDNDTLLNMYKKATEDAALNVVTEFHMLVEGDFAKYEPVPDFSKVKISLDDSPNKPEV